jgi:hypothetical protein
MSAVVVSAQANIFLGRSSQRWAGMPKVTERLFINYRTGLINIQEGLNKSILDFSDHEIQK